MNVGGRRASLALVLGGAVLLVATSCTASDETTSRRTTLRVFAATSLRAVFGELERSFEDEHADVDVELTFGGSSALAAQVRQGAPAHVLATADEQTMRTALPEDADPPRTAFARNRLAIVVEPTNPKRIMSLSDLGRDDIAVVLCAPAVPCGRLAAAALERAGVRVEARSLEENVGGVRAKVELGEADAGVVYVTDAIEAGDELTRVDDPRLADPSLEAVYPMAILEGAPQPAARSWVAFVRSDAGRRALERRGFLAP